jgi:Ca2+-binding RTX toxin-like protein
MTSGGTKLAGSGTHAMSVTGTFAQINADLATLSYTAGSSTGTDSISVNVWDQAGLSSTKSVGVTVSPEPTIAIATTNADPTELVSNTIITATAGNHMIFIGGTGDTITATGGTETVQAFEGNNKVTTGAGNDTISFGGTGNTINAGGGSNTLNDSGSDNTIVMPGAGQGFDNVFGYVLQNGDLLDFRAALATTSWNGAQSTLGSFLHVTTSGANAIISLSTTSGGAATQVADLEGAGQVSLSTLLSHAIT